MRANFSIFVPSYNSFIISHKRKVQVTVNHEDKKTIAVDSTRKIVSVCVNKLTMKSNVREQVRQRRDREIVLSYT